MNKHPKSLWLSALFIHLHVAEAALDLNFGDDGDLSSFVTRPEIKAPVFQLTYHSHENVSPGYWFIAPYAKVGQEPFPQYYHQVCSTGPHIYDADGSLIWSGACQSRNQNVCDFRAFTDENGAEYLSMINHGWDKSLRGYASVVDSTYDLSKARNVSQQILDTEFNMHEFKVIEHGRSALYLTQRKERIDVPEFNEDRVGWVTAIGFREVDIASGDVLFEWFSSDRVTPSESTAPLDKSAFSGVGPHGWSFFHPNSVDKSDDGDYMAIYKISGSDGSIMWRLGGSNSSWYLDGFNFSKQHDAQFLGFDDAGRELISFFDNAVAHQNEWKSDATSNISSCLVVALNYQTMAATVVQRIWRPDGRLTALRGNCQHQQNSNVVASWSENAYVSEHSPSGTLLLEGRFASRRFVTYRAYKFEFTGQPIEPPVVKAVVHGLSRDTSSTAWYVSWNGATEVASWRFRRLLKDGNSVVMGQSKKRGFETRYISDGTAEMVFVEAIAANGSVIGRSDNRFASLPPEWSIEGVPPNVEQVEIARDEL